MIRAALLGLALAVVPAEALDVGVQPYRDAAQAGAVGTVSGRVYAEARTPGGQPKPLSGATITLLPKSQALFLSFEGFKEDARRSSKQFTAAALSMRRAQEAYERELLQAGFPDLAPRIAVGPDGAFSIPDVPAGAWLVVVWHSSPMDVSSPKAKSKERQLYQMDGRLTGFQAVSVWLREVTIAKGETATLELTDRNEWFRGVIEEKTRGAVR